VKTYLNQIQRSERRTIFAMVIDIFGNDTGAYSIFVENTYSEERHGPRVFGSHFVTNLRFQGCSLASISSRNTSYFQALGEGRPKQDQLSVQPPSELSYMVWRPWPQSQESCRP